MKDSGIEWIGDIPVDWSVIKFKYLHNGLNTGEAIDKNFWSSNERDKVFYTAGLIPIRTNYKDFPEWKYTKDNDLLLARNGTPYVYFPEIDACYTDHIIRAEMKKGINRRFVQYGLQQSISSVVVESVSIATWSASLWNEQTISWPSYNEQCRIVEFLDKKCAEIDAVVEKTKATIEEYKKLKQSIITEAVTKGIRENHEMMGTEYEWIGQIPSTWKAIKVKWLLDERKERSEAGEEESLSMSQKFGLVPTKEMDMIPNMAASFVGAKLVYVGDLVFNKLKAHLGVFAVSKYDGLVSPDYAVYYPTGVAIVKYLEYLFKTPQYIAEFRKKSSGVGVGLTRLYTDDLFSIYCSLPPMDEQEEIVAYLDKKCVEMDTLIARKISLLEEMESYKKSVIYEYVTGKKEV